MGKEADYPFRPWLLPFFPGINRASAGLIGVTDYRKLPFAELGFAILKVHNDIFFRISMVLAVFDFLFSAFRSFRSFCFCSNRLRPSRQRRDSFQHL